MVSDLPNWILDIKAAELVAYPPASSVGANVADGFYQAFLNLQSGIDSALTHLAQQVCPSPAVCSPTCSL